jgi:hypothetical protein
MKKSGAFLILAMILAGCNSSMLLPAPTQAVAEPEIVILTETLQTFHECCSPARAEVKDNLYSFSCRHSADSDILSPWRALTARQPRTHNSRQAERAIPSHVFTIMISMRFHRRTPIIAPSQARASSGKQGDGSFPYTAMITTLFSL